MFLRARTRLCGRKAVSGFVRRVMTFVTAASLVLSPYTTSLAIERMPANPDLITPLEPGLTVSRPIDVDTFALAEHLGEIKFSYKGKSDMVVVHIQDAHCNWFAQRNISEIIDYLSREYGVDLVNLEGGAGIYDLDVFTSISGDAIRKEVADYFMKKGEMNGAEFYAAANPGRVALWGIEDKGLYVDNLKIYRESLTYKSRVDAWIARLSSAVAELKKKVYTPELIKLDSAYESYKASTMDFRQYIEFLIAKAGEEGVKIEDYRNIDLLRQAMLQEGKVDFKRANSERNVLVEELKKNMSKNAIKELVSLSLDFKTNRVSKKAFYGYLANTAVKLGTDMSRYPSLDAYVKYVSTYEAVDQSKIMEEMDGLEKALREKLYRSDTERELAKVSKNLAILKNVFAYSLTKTDYRYYLDNVDSFAVPELKGIIERESKRFALASNLDPSISELDAYREKVSKFYEFSFKRDDAFLKNIKYQNIGNKRVAVIMTGGFHTENLCELFKKDDISYVSILPKFRSEKGYQSPYFGVLAGETTDVQKMLKSVIAAQTAMLQVASMLSSELAQEVWGRAGIEAFHSEVEVRRLLEEWAALHPEGCEVKVMDGNKELFTVSKGATPAKNSITIDISLLREMAQDIFLDPQIAAVMEGKAGSYKDLDAKDPAMKAALEFLTKTAEELDKMGHKEAAVALRNAASELANRPVRLLSGVTGFKGHAGGQGIYINASAVKGEKDLASVFIHEAIASYAHFHSAAHMVEELYLGKGKVTDLAALAEKGVMRDRPIWAVPKADRWKGGRDVAAGVPLAWDNMTLDEKIEQLGRWQAAGVELEMVVNYSGVRERYRGKIMTTDENGEPGIERAIMGPSTLRFSSVEHGARTIIAHIDSIKPVQEAEVEAYNAAMTGTPSESYQNGNKVDFSVADDLEVNFSYSSLTALGAEELSAEDLRELMKDFLGSFKYDIANFLEASDKVTIKKMEFVGSGGYKHVVKVTAEADGETVVFGLRLMKGNNLASIEKQYEGMEENAEQEMKQFQELRELDGVGIFVKRAIYVRKMNEAGLIREDSRLDQYLRQRYIGAITLGEFAEGETLNKVQGDEARNKAYQQAVNTVVRGWLLTYDDGYGVTIEDLKGDNMVLRKESGKQEPVVYIDVGMPQKYGIRTVMEKLRALMRELPQYSPGEDQNRRNIELARTIVDRMILAMNTFKRIEAPAKRVKGGLTVEKLSKEINERYLPLLLSMREVLKKDNITEEDLEEGFLLDFQIKPGVNLAKTAGLPDTQILGPAEVPAEAAAERAPAAEEVIAPAAPAKAAEFAPGSAMNIRGMNKDQQLEVLRALQAQGAKLVFTVDWGGGKTQDFVDVQIAEGEGDGKGIEDYGPGVLMRVQGEPYTNIMLSSIKEFRVAGAAQAAEAVAEEAGGAEVTVAKNLEMRNFESSPLYDAAALKELLERIKGEIGATFPFVEKLEIKALDYAGHGASKNAIKVEAIADGKPIIFGIRLYNGSKSRSISSQYETIEKVAEDEIQSFKDFRELDGVAIFVKRPVHVRQMLERGMVKNVGRNEAPDRVMNFLDANALGSVSIGEFADGLDMQKISQTEEERAFDEAINTIVRGWLLTYNKGKGVSISDLKPDNMVYKQNAHNIQENVVYIDLDQATEMTFETMMERIRNFVAMSKTYKAFGDDAKADNWADMKTIKGMIAAIETFFAREAETKVIKGGIKAMDLRKEIYASGIVKSLRAMERAGAIDQAMMRVSAEAPDMVAPSVASAAAAPVRGAPLVLPFGDEAPAAGAMDEAARAASVDARKASSVEFFSGVGRKADTVKAVVGVPAGMDQAKMAALIRNVNRGLAKAGFGERTDSHQLIIYEIEVKDEAKTRENYEKAMEDAQKGLPSDGRVILFAPQMEAGPQLAAQAQADYKAQGNITVVPDAYTDANVQKSEFPDMLARIGLARNIAFYFNGNDKIGAIGAINNILRQITGNEEIASIEQLLNVLNPLKIKAIDFGEMTRWMESQEAVAVSL